ncbi:MAG: hypothetical protein RLZZ176_161 [Cyanobacteriota bacterium]
MTSQDFIIHHGYTYIAIRLGILILALLLWFICTATPVI